MRKSDFNKVALLCVFVVDTKPVIILTQSYLQVGWHKVVLVPYLFEIQKYPIHLPFSANHMTCINDSVLFWPKTTISLST